ncbi:MlaC/ttg2D family ABC transporter substrate-binding protein [Pseudohalioglobus lutimaris]|uniref:Toluene tolerance protein n=1 Tax=Pseudohalioglobus lutimaris TaxID=1737061 RepID=A0A2N5X670_9GAMM|nr:ABC transporter substrate-binding protein [Pseudohalioglobus lutimaris]PLW69984.1 toluene tolerance protein [Pseudohalioglobus lutimaris]
MKFRMQLSALLWVLALALGANAQQGVAQADAGVTAHEVVEATTSSVMAVVSEAKEYAEEDPERYYQSIQEILDPVVDFRGFARGVMGPYATSERYRSLDADGQAQLRSQLDRFTEVMRRGMVRTYGKGLLAFGGSRIQVSSPSLDEAEASRVSVEQLIYSDAVEPYVVMYQMGRDRSGEWKLRNMIIESVNLGEIYQSQFESAARKQKGDLDTVIDTWSAPEVDS